MLVIELAVLNFLFEYAVHDVAQDQCVAYLRLLEHVLEDGSSDARIRADYLSAGNSVVWVQNDVVVALVVDNHSVLGLFRKCSNDSDEVS
jgi:hypothetical protein